MQADLSEEEMRRALFGSSGSRPLTSTDSSLSSGSSSEPSKHKSKIPNKPLSPKLRVTMRVSREFEGVSELMTYDANTLSTLMAEQEAKAQAKKKKFKYIDIVSVTSV